MTRLESLLMDSDNKTHPLLVLNILLLAMDTGTIILTFEKVTHNQLLQRSHSCIDLILILTFDGFPLFLCR